MVSHVPGPEPIKRTVLPEPAWQDLAADLLGPLPLLGPYGTVRARGY